MNHATVPGSRITLGKLVSNAIVTSLSSANVCVYCHDEGTHHNFPQQWDYSDHAKGEFVGYAGNRSGCANCHSGSGFVAYVKNGQQTPDETPAGMNITCATCHDPHDASNPGQLRLVSATLNQMVMKYHYINEGQTMYELPPRQKRCS
ncbi:MAG: hypothetical protein U5K00_13370 [Melioribacteraceae bacterium]|nr:hypothetical protein [Melioribacteraceae bacterium]